MALLNYFGLKNTQKDPELIDRAVNTVALAIGAFLEIAGKEDIKLIKENLVNTLDIDKSGLLTIEIRPVNVENIRDYYDRERLFVKSA
ncbi:hypothetical protein OMAG_000091 [Candidatus Omnitrophus magneticus]|uniref:Uncharacterized protein n=1 Tax=Candidatus Omnitrophus magneticus TaxID=1609969 RepID=A0A0F0CRX6_9BACT|nr:hypothetical protein OMAG_000091 [Candidatus Omnitrophus magneticus]